MKTNKKNENKFDVVGWIISIAVAVVVFLIGNYLCLPRIGWSFGLLGVIALSIIAGLVCSLIRYDMCYNYNDAAGVSRNVILGILVGAIVLAIVVSCVASCVLFHQDAAKNRMNMTTVSQEELVEMLPDITEDGAYSWIDSASAKKLAARKMGELTELVGLYTANSDVTTAVKSGKLTKYVPLGYAGFFKATKADTIPGYMDINPVSQDGDYVEGEIKYSPSAYFGKDLMRHLRRNYPNDYLGNYTFQTAPDGTRYWVCELKKGCGSWFIQEVYAVAMVDAETGKSTKYILGEQPEWVVAIHGETAMEYYNTYGSLVNGWWNPSKVGETMTTDDFGYVSVNGQMHYITGITSAVTDGGDEANLGVMLFNAHTNEGFYCQVAGAEEHSAMEVAEGVVQNYGYTAAFPNLTNIDGRLTYTMVMKDDNGIIKQYGMVNYENYTIAVTADTLAACRVAYNKAMTQNGVVDTDSSNWTEIDIAVDAIEYIVQGGETTVYIRDTQGNVYKAAFDERFLFADTGDMLVLSIVDDSSEIKVVVFGNLVEVEIEEVVEPEVEEVESEETE